MLKRTGRKIIECTGAIAAILLVTVSALLCFSVKWMFDTWKYLTLDELIFHLNAPLEGTNQDMIREYINLCIVPTVLVFIFVVLLFAAWRNKKKYYAAIGSCVVLSIVASAIALYVVWTNLEIGEYAEAQKSDTDFIKENYIDPADVALTFPEQKRNLIYIFLESMEITYADQSNGGAFEQNVIPDLTCLAQENEDFSGKDDKLNGAYVTTGASWTMGGMFAHTSGLPLNIPIEKNSMDTQESFFPGIITIGDILEQEGYSQTLMIGSEAMFGGRELYFTEHGSYDILDYYYARDNGLIPSDYWQWWGYEDEKLFRFAKERLIELASQEKPFNFTMLTADTHFEDGYHCRLCTDEFGENHYANVMRCSDKQVLEFINWIQQQSFYENTTIVVTGDHLTMDSDFCEDISTEYERKGYTVYINAAAEPEKETKREYTTFDNFPTTLGALGVEIEGNRLGLGTNLFSDVQTLTEKLGYEEEDKGIKQKSEFMEELSNVDENSKMLLRREGVIPSAKIWTDVYQYELGILPVFVKDIKNVPENIVSVTLSIWTKPDQSDVQWADMYYDGSGDYFYGEINVPAFGYYTGEYYIKAYALDDAGNQYELGETTGIVE